MLAIQQYARTALRDVIGGRQLDEVLTERESIGHEIEQLVTRECEHWGLEVAGIRIQDIILPEDLKRVMSRQAAAEREKRANITKSEGDRLAAENLAAAAHTMAASPGAMQLRSLQTIDGLGPTASNTVVLAIPIEMMEAVDAIAKIRRGEAKSTELESRNKNSFRQHQPTRGNYHIDVMKIQELRNNKLPAYYK
jgi:regulator of protease activity HflC (stomatin/prohibitin superfamily)